MIRRCSVLLVSALVAATVALIPGAAHAAPARDDSLNEPVYFVPGFTFALFGEAPKHDCWNGYWKPAGDAMRSWGWKGSYHTVSFYDGDTNCNTKILASGGDRNVSLHNLGYLLAWNIYQSYSKNNVSVDVMAHSMGGLIIRAALTGVARHEPNWPPYLLVEDVVTFDTPHRGNTAASLCAGLYGYQQCVDMSPGSAFLKWLYQGPQSAQGTDWTLVGCDDDDIVPTDSALGMTAGHYVRYDASQGLEHGAVHQTVSGNYYMRWKNYYESAWSEGWGAPPVRSGNNALYFWWRW